MRRMTLGTLALLACVLTPALLAQANLGYYRDPAIFGDTIVFTSEGDLWQVGADGGVARRLTTHPGEERYAAFSADGKTLAFSADYEGPREVYTMPASGGLPSRRTFDGAVATVVGWTRDNKVLYATRRYSTLPDTQLATVDADNRTALVPLSQAAQGTYDSRGATLFFTRLPFQGSYAKRYQGGTAQKVWRYTAGSEATGLTTDYAGTSKDAMWWNGRVYFLTDRDGTMNLWSIDETGKNLRQHTRHTGWDAQSPSLGQGRIVYQLGASLRLFEINSGRDREVTIELASDFDHLREHWVKDPNYDKTAKIYELALTKGLRSPFQPADELHPDKAEEASKPTEKLEEKKAEAGAAVPSPPVNVAIDLDGVAARIREVPVPGGNYRSLTAAAKRLCWLDTPDRAQREKTNLQCLDVANKGDKPETLVEEVRSYEIFGDGKKMLVRKQNDLYVAGQDG